MSSNEGIRLSDHFTYRKLIRFTLPTIVMMIFTSIYGVVDGIFVSNIVGDSAFAAVNLIMPALMIPGTIGFMFGTGGSAIVAKTLGEGDTQRANRYFSMIVLTEVLIGVLLTVVGLAVLEPVTYLLGADEVLAPYCIEYGRIVFIGLVAFVLQNSFQSFMVTANKPVFGLVVTLMAGFSNMLLDFLFVYCFGWGVSGAAWASVISQCVGALVPLFYFLGKNQSLLRLVRTGFEWRPLLRACTNGSSEMVTNLSFSVVNMMYNHQLMQYLGQNGITAYGIIMYVGFIFVGIYLGYSFGIAPVIGYHYGANNRQELQSLLRKSVKLLAAAALVLTIAAELSARLLAGIFVSYDENLLTLTTGAIRLYSLSYLIGWLNIFASSFFTALNDGLSSAVISFSRTFLFQLSMIFVLPLWLGADGIWAAIIAAEVLSLAVSLFLIIRHRKKYGYGGEMYVKE